MGAIVASQSAMLQTLGREKTRLSDRRLAASYLQHVGQVRHLLSSHPESIQVLSVNYHEALADPNRTAAGVNRFRGGFLDESRMAATVDPSLHCQRPAAR